MDKDFTDDPFLPGSPPELLESGEFNTEVEDEKGQPAPMIDGTFGLSEADKEMMKEVGMMEEENPFFCKVCNINCQSQGPFEVHLMGVPHAKKVTNLNSS